MGFGFTLISSAKYGGQVLLVFSNFRSKLLLSSARFYINYFVDIHKISSELCFILRMLIIFKFIRGTGIKVLRKLLILFLMF